MEVDRRRGLHHAAQFNKAGRHHRQVGHHVVVAEERPEGLEHLGDLAATFHGLPEHRFRLAVPSPRVGERLDLRGGQRAITFLKEDVVRLIALEGWVEVDEVNALGVHCAAAQDAQVVAEIERVHEGDRLRRVPPIDGVNLSRLLSPPTGAVNMRSER